MMSGLVQVIPTERSTQSDFALDVSTTTIGHDPQPSKEEETKGRNIQVRPTETLQNIFINGCT